MRRVAASIVYINEKEFRNHVVELFDHLLVNHYPLEGELPMTEWLGGTIIIRGREAFHTRLLLSPAELSAYDSGGDGYIERL
jgi:hypothetical protein